MAVMHEKQGHSDFPVRRARSAPFGGLFFHPVRFLRWTGCLRYRPVSYRAFDPQAVDRPALFSAPDPASAVPGTPWTASRAIDTAMAHSIVVENGIANCLGYVFDKKGRLIDGGTHKHREGRRYQRWIKRGRYIRPHPIFPRLAYYTGNVAVLTASNQRYFFHWLLDVLPRFAILAAVRERIDGIYIENRRPFQRETLELAGIDTRRIINSGDVALLTARKLVVPCHQIMNGREFPAWAIRYLRDRFLPVSAGGTVSAGGRIFLSRESAAHRRLKNEREIIDRLRAYGFREVKPETLCFRDQVRLFRDARVIVAPHGSALANLVFCSPGTRVIEILPAANIDLYYRLSTALRLDYHYVKDRCGDPDRWTFEDYGISWEDLKTTLDAAGITPRRAGETTSIPPDSRRTGRCGH